ncbi:hypothetical protein FHG64_17805 [Antarcticibacterium flavum]|uniref:SusE outer membrane protein domain-containing protein n=1 Tax=Antarcticibacterium flavum TaxID=2058175 RepID=A0A5B7X906_9FLAO|nr:MULTISPECIES: SusE domain-containing protein [Antarcticibacterium]MCM4160877.1 hypothetical protein [Antarcticibacterium sp. W02-3]QCY71101.1 hypothetical protein FHG64_17805 [Antarcticibacterium flavum]
MKKIKILLCAFIALGFLYSCEEEDNMAAIGEWDLSEPVLELSNSNIILNETIPGESFEFSWEPAVSSERYQVRYTLVIDTVGSDDYNSPILSKVSGNGGRETSASFTASEIDQALSFAGYEAGAESNVEIAVIATSIDKQAVDAQELSVTRFETEYKPQNLYLSGVGTEAGTNLADAIPFRALNNADGQLTYRFETYTQLEAGQGFRIYSNPGMPAHIYGGNDGELVKNGGAISVAESGVYRLTIDLETETYELLKIDRLGIVGDVIPDGWGGDEALEYTGNGTWKSEMSLQEGGFLFRLNGDWGYLFKRIQGTQDRLYMESQAGDAGIQIEDIPLSTAGNYIITVDLSGDTYTYSLEREAVVSNPPSETPENLYLLSNGETVATFEKDGDVFRSVTYIALQASASYQLNSAEDGSGTAYSLNGMIGDTSNPDGDSAAGSIPLVEGEDDIAVARDQAYLLNFNFESGSLSWKYYNIKLFHWSNWDDRDEFLMTYVHPYKFTTTQPLEAGYEMKFNSPWDIQFGADDPSAMSGTMTNAGDSSNFVNITSSGTYTANIEVSEDYQTGTYEFIAE